MWAIPKTNSVQLKHIPDGVDPPEKITEPTTNYNKDSKFDNWLTPAQTLMFITLMLMDDI